jgi:hypothetical protein
MLIFGERFLRHIKTGSARKKQNARISDIEADGFRRIQDCDCVRVFVIIVFLTFFRVDGWV